ncbi:hypothetical protein LL999_27060 [Burkholderia ambifaria]|uniref:hypothetical protein n=1 Tax=Burkholderia ambifaria TaxID=152480 RepID=UPI001E42013A|nr:hypothetical protein [Burkholderia ambifaria]UEP23871.1 hypothetical protein LL999_27060 [Burkholderia ambifaria]
MNECRDFFHIFKGNMEALGLDVPTSWFGAQATTLANVSALIAATEKLGKTATVSELAGATLVSEKLLVAGALYASYYTGAAIGSAMVASAERLKCGRTADVSTVIRDFQSQTAVYALQPSIAFENASRNIRHGKSRACGICTQRARVCSPPI